MLESLPCRALPTFWTSPMLLVRWTSQSTLARKPVSDPVMLRRIGFEGPAKELRTVYGLPACYCIPHALAASLLRRPQRSH